MFSDFNTFFDNYYFFECNSFDLNSIESFISKESQQNIILNDSLKELPQVSSFHDTKKEKNHNFNEELFIQKKQKKNSPNKSTFYSSKKENNIQNNNIENIGNIEIKINNNIQKDNNKLGRKKKESKEKGKHTKFTDDNIIKKIKNIVNEKLRNCINKLIKGFYGCNLFPKKELLKLKKQEKKSKADYNKDLLYMKVKDIFSDEISTKYKNFIYTKDYNKNLINELLNEKDNEKRTFFEKIFNLTFVQVLKHFRKEIFIEELNGLTRIDEVCENFDNNKGDKEEYKKYFKYFVGKFEEKINKKNPRNRAPDKHK